MKNIIFLTLAALVLGGCSEMRIMTKAAFKEMNCDIVNLEQERFRRGDQAPASAHIVAQASAEAAPQR